MESNSTNRRILIAVGFVLFFVIIVLVWYFYYAKPITDPGSDGPKNPFPSSETSPRFRFIGREWETEEATSTTVVSDPLAEPLVKIWDRPAVGQIFITDQILKEITTTTTEGTSTVMIKKMVRATSTIVLFVDKITGYVYGYPLETGKAFQISNSVIPGIHDAYFFDEGKRILMRYYDQEKRSVIGIVATIPSNSNRETAFPLENIEYLSGEVGSITVTGDKKTAAYAVITENGTNIYTITGSAAPKIFTSSPFREWKISYGGNLLYATTRPSAYVEGSTFSVPGFQSEISNKTGLLTLPSRSGLFLSSMWGRQGLATFLSRNGSTNVLSVKTLAPKCAFGYQDLLVCAVPKNLGRTTEGLPDDWYQGRILFDDELKFVDQATGDSFLLYSFDEASVGSFDITSIEVSNQNDLFSFTRKQDDTLWLLNTNLLGE